MGIPGTESAENPRGIMVQVFWEQDESGGLCISGHSAEIAVPPNLQPTPSLSANSSRRLGRGPANGFVIDPFLVTNSS